MAASTVSQLDLGAYLKIVSKGAVYNNLSEDSAVWEMIKKKKKGPQEGRELRFLLRSAYGAGAGGFVPVDGGAYPTAQQAKVKEGISQYKDFALTIEVERTAIEKAISDFSRYGEPLAEELRSKTIVLSRLLSGAAYRDGSGRLGQVSAESLTDGTPNPNGTPTTMELTLSSTYFGHIGWIEQGDRLKFFDANAAEVNAPGTDIYWEVTDINRTTDTFTVTRTANGSTFPASVVGAYVYRAIQQNIPTDAEVAADDANSLSEEWCGLEALSAADGRTVNGIQLSGSFKGSRLSANGNPIDSQDFQKLMSKIMVAVGQGRYKYSKALMAWETYDALVESREVDRRFNTITDNKRGVASLGYVHTKNSLMFEPDEFCPKQRIYVCPDADVIQFYGSDFDFVKPDGGQKFMLKPNSAGGHDRAVRAYMEGQGSLLSVHSPAIGVLSDFTA